MVRKSESQQKLTMLTCTSEESVEDDDSGSPKQSSVPAVGAPPPSSQALARRSTESVIDIPSHFLSSSQALSRQTTEYASSQGLSRQSTESVIEISSPLLSSSQGLSRRSTESVIESSSPLLLSSQALSRQATEYASSQGLSRRSTESVIDVPSSSLSSFLPSSQALSRRSTESIFSSSSSIRDNRDKLSRILTAVRDVTSRCRVCWVHGGDVRPHRTFKCPKKICSGREWQIFKTSLQFPKNTVCYFCLSPYAPPFDHPQPPPGTEKSADLCEYPDVLKELVYILYQDQFRRKKIFTKLGVSPPPTLYLYQRFIGKSKKDGILGAYEVVNAYLELQESGEFKSVGYC